MKCKPIQYIGMLLCTGLMLFSSCTREESFEGPGNGNGSKLEGEGFLSLGFHTGDLSALTRSETPGSAAEQRVNAVRVVLYDDGTEGDEPTVQYVFHYNISTNPTPGDGNDYFIGDGLYINGTHYGSLALYNGNIDATQFITYAQGIERKNYQMLVIVNPTYEASTTAGSNNLTVAQMEAGTEAKSPIDVYWRTRKGQPLSLMTDPDVDANHLVPLSHTEISGYGGIADNNGSGNFLMTNVQDLIQIAAEDIPVSKTAAHANPFEITVDRMVAKIIVQKESDGSDVTVPSGASVYDVAYLLDRQNRYSHWWRNLNFLKGRSEWDSNSDLLEEPGDNSTRDERYAMSPNFGDLLGGWIYSANYFFYEPDNSTSNLSESDFKALSGPGSAVGQYLLENALNPNLYTWGDDYYTRVLIRANYCPAGITKGESYYVYNGKAISQTQMNTYRSAVETLALNLGALTGSSGNYTPVDGIFPATSADEPAGMSGLYYAIFKVEYYGLIPPATGSDVLSGSRTESFDGSVAYGIGYYYKGINYYAAPIRHFDFSDGSVDNPSADTYGYYGVVRNNIYTVTIRSINGPGSSTPTGSSYISAGVNIQPWGYAGKNIDLGQETPVMTFVTYKYYLEGGSDPIMTTYDTNAAVGATIPVTSIEILNKYKAFANSLNANKYGNGFIRTYPGSSTVSLDPAQNVVEIEYPELSTHEVKIIYNFQDEIINTRGQTRSNYRGSEIVLLPEVEHGTPIDMAFMAEHAGFAFRKEPQELAGTDQWFIYKGHDYFSESGGGQLPIPSLEEDVMIEFRYERSQFIGAIYVYYYEYNNQHVLLEDIITRNDLNVGATIPLDATMLNAQLQLVNSLGLGTFLPGILKTAPESPTLSENNGKNIVEILYKQGSNPQAYSITLHHWDANNNRDLIPPVQASGLRYGEILSKNYMSELRSQDPSLSHIMPWWIEENGVSYTWLEEITIVSQGEGTGAPVVYDGISYTMLPIPLPGNDVHVYFQYAHTYLDISYSNMYNEPLYLAPGNRDREFRFDVTEGDVIDENTTSFVRDFSSKGYVLYHHEGLPLTITSGGNSFSLKYSPPWSETNVYLVYQGEVLCKAGTYREGDPINLDGHIATINDDLIAAGYAGGSYSGSTSFVTPPYTDWTGEIRVNIVNSIDDTSVPITMQPNKTKDIAIYVNLSYGDGL